MAIVAQASSKIEFVNLEKAYPSSAAHSNIVHLARGAYRLIRLAWMELSVSWHKTASQALLTILRAVLKVNFTTATLSVINHT